MPAYAPMTRDGLSKLKSALLAQGERFAQAVHDHPVSKAARQHVYGQDAIPARYRDVPRQRPILFQQTPMPRPPSAIYDHPWAQKARDVLGIKTIPKPASGASRSY